MFALQMAFALAGTVAALPIARDISSNNFEPSFVPAPKGRGTIDLLISSLSTLILCVWTAIHPNLIDNPTTIRCLKSKAQFVILSIIAPDLLLSFAFKEWWTAKRTVEKVQLLGAAAMADEIAMWADEIIAKATAYFPKAEAYPSARQAVQKAREAVEVVRQSAENMRHASALIPAGGEKGLVLRG